MSESNNTITDTSPSVTLTVGQLRDMMREEIQEALSQNSHTEECLLTAEAAAGMLSVSPDWIYRNAKKLPFTRKIGPKMLRFSQQGLLKWLTTRKLS
ncbi:MAG: helix-turn-helix domain-containing protein [Candidatus Binatia bacterium]